MCPLLWVHYKLLKVCYALLVEWFDGVSGRQVWEHPEESEELWKKIEVFWKELNGESRRNKMPCKILRLSAAEQVYFSSGHVST